MEFESVLKLMQERQQKNTKVTDLIMYFPGSEHGFVPGATYSLTDKGIERPIPGRGWFNAPPPHSTDFMNGFECSSLDVDLYSSRFFPSPELGIHQTLYI